MVLRQAFKKQILGELQLSLCGCMAKVSSLARLKRARFSERT